MDLWGDRGVAGHRAGDRRASAAWRKGDFGPASDGALVLPLVLAGVHRRCLIYIFWTQVSGPGATRPRFRAGLSLRPLVAHRARGVFLVRPCGRISTSLAVFL